VSDYLIFDIAQISLLDFVLVIVNKHKHYYCICFGTIIRVKSEVTLVFFYNEYNVYQ